jgi:hypothetical protein
VNVRMFIDLVVADQIAPALVRHCRAELSDAPPGALPELLERLAAQRLADNLARSDAAN